MHPLKSAAHIYAAIAVLFLVSYGASAVLRVPVEFPTIQSALNAVNQSDTVLVAPGRYHEFLVGPAHSFVLLGEYSPDTVETEWTVLDPIPPVNADTPSVVTLVGDSVVLKNIAFFNRLELRQPDWATRAGGVRNFCQLLRVSNCRFDSVSAAIWGGACIILDTCEFSGCVWQCVDPTSPTGSVTANSCLFDGAGYTLVSGFDHSSFRFCNFKCNSQGGHFLRIGGTDIRVSQCRFGPCLGAFPVLTVYPGEEIEILENTFEGIDRAASIISIEVNCQDWQDPPVTIRGNLFRDYERVPPATGVTAIDAECLLQTTGLLCSIEDNVFRDATASALIPAGIRISSSLRLHRNVFTELSPEESADINAVRPFPDSVFATNNSFLPPGLAASTAGSYFDARNNWWGDSTGPFNAGANPNGQGSEVGNGVLFDPWLTAAPDTTDTNGVFIDGIILASPESFSLSAFPNPFNATTTLTIVVARPGIFAATLFDITGRRVRELFRGPITATETIRLDASVLSTGVYFARLESAEQSFAVTKLLLLK